MTKQALRSSGMFKSSFENFNLLGARRKAMNHFATLKRFPDGIDNPDI